MLQDFTCFMLLISKKCLPLTLNCKIQISKTMAKRKDLKKNINYICNELLAEVLSISLYEPTVSEATAQNTIQTILKMRQEMLSRISHTESGNVKLFYKKLRSDFNAQVDDVISQIGNIQ